jgi:hypothetical protein
MKKIKNILLVIVITPLLSNAQPKEINNSDFSITTQESYPTYIPEMTYGENGTLANDTAALPIDSHLWFLLLLGSIYVYVKFFIVHKKTFTLSKEIFKKTGA